MTPIKKILSLLPLALLALTASATELRFDLATFCCECGPEERFCQHHLDHLNLNSGQGHFIAMGTDAHRQAIQSHTNVLVAYYNSLNDNWAKISGAQKADLINSMTLKNFAKTGARPKWLIINEISAGLWPESQKYRTWVSDVLFRLKNTHGYSVILCAPFVHPGEHNKDWQAIGTNAFIGIECYLSGQWVVDHGNSVEACRKEYQTAKNMYQKRGIPESRLFLVEHFANTVAGKPWGRGGVSTEDWGKAIVTRATAAHQVKFAGFMSYAWSKNGMHASDEEMLHFEDLYEAQPLP